VRELDTFDARLASLLATLRAVGCVCARRPCTCRVFGFGACACRGRVSSVRSVRRVRSRGSSPCGHTETLTLCSETRRARTTESTMNARGTTRPRVRCPRSVCLPSLSRVAAPRGHAGTRARRASRGASRRPADRTRPGHGWTWADCRAADWRELRNCRRTGGRTSVRCGARVCGSAQSTVDAPCARGPPPCRSFACATADARDARRGRGTRGRGTHSAQDRHRSREKGHRDPENVRDANAIERPAA
jgi:hypothetical protein